MCIVDGFTVYASYLEASEMMDEETAKEFMYSVVKYGLNEEEYTGKNQMVKMAMKLVMPTIDANIKKRSAGGKGGRPPKEDDEVSGNRRKSKRSL